MKRVLVFGLVLALLASFMAPATPFGAAQVQAASAQTYQVVVGYEKVNQGAVVEAFFPDTVTIHVGDTVHWVQNSHEIHTVTFLAGTTAPELLEFTPNGPAFNGAAIVPTLPANGLYNGLTFANSGLMSTDPGSATSFDLTFTTAGTYDYICLVHGVLMSGKVIVVAPSKNIPSPAQSAARGKQQLAKQISKIGDVIEHAASMVTPPSRNSDGSTTYHVMIGFSQGQIDLMRFFPRNLNVRQGDTVEWSYGAPMAGMSMAPHTITFLNGADDPSLTLKNSLLINPVVFLSSGGPSLTRNGYFNSGLLGPGQAYSLKIGDIKGVIDYECLLHDPSGMVASLNVLPKH